MISRYNVKWIDENGSYIVEFFFNDYWNAINYLHKLESNSLIKDAKLDIKY